MTPPTILSTNSYSSSRPSGSNFNQTCPYCPFPPLCLTNFPSTSTVSLIVSLYATCGLPILASTENSLFILSTRTSRWSSPIPDIIVWPDSSSLWTLNDGSSCASLPRANDIFSWSGFDLGSTATDMTGSGKSILSRTICLFESDKVSPVVISLRPIHAAISPARTSLISSLLLECIWTILPTLSFFDLVELITASPTERTPE